MNIYRELNKLKEQQTKLLETVRDISVGDTITLSILHNVIEDLNKIKEGETHMKNIYVVEVVDKKTGFAVLTSAAYRTLEKAQAFIMSCSEEVEQRSNFIFDTESTQYRIAILQIGE